MNEDKLREIAKETLQETIDSSFIYGYVKNLEKENIKLKEKLHEKNMRIIELNKLVGDCKD